MIWAEEKGEWSMSESESANLNDEKKSKILSIFA